MASITTRVSRAKLKKRREPYWHRLQKGQYLGFRRGPDTWLVRFRDRAGKQQYQALGGKDLLPEYDDARAKADEWLTQLAGQPVRSARRGTVRDALEAYLQHLRDHGRASTSVEAEGRFRCVLIGKAAREANGKARAYPAIPVHPLADMRLEDATREDFEDWRRSLREGRENRSLNRMVRAVIAALNWAADNGHVGNRIAWHLKPLVDDMEDAEPLFLSKDQRAVLIAAAETNASKFFRGLEYTGARPGELAAAKVSDLAGGKLTLSSRKGRGGKLRTRAVTLGVEGASFFKAQAKDKLPGAFLFTEDGEQPWRGHMWARRFNEAAAAHNAKVKGKKKAKATIPSEASAYSFRHARISELLQLHGIDPLTVGKQTGTSLAMIEKYYYRFIGGALDDKLKGIA